MSHARLRQKADLYAAYTAADVWHDKHLFLPALLFLTTASGRAQRFLAALQSALSNNRRSYSRHTLVAGAGALALEPSRLIGTACLLDFDGEELLTLRDVLEAARAPYEQMQRANQKRRESRDRKRTRLREDPAIARKALRRFQDSHSSLDELGSVGRRATQIVIAATDTPTEQEQAALQAFVGDLEDVLVQPGFLRPPPVSNETRQAVTLLVAFYQERQRRLIDELAARYGESRSIRHAREILRDEGLLDHYGIGWLPGAASKDATARDEQHRRRLAYLEWREDAAQSLVRKTGPLARLTHSREEFYPQIDREQLRVCGRCREIVYPPLDKAPTPTGELPPACHYCGGRERLKPYEQAAQAHDAMEGCL